MQEKILQGKVALVTGSTRGIGTSIAEALLEEGAKVYIHCRKEEIVKAKAEKMGAEFVFGDLTQEDEIDNLIKHITDKENKLDILVNNAGFEKRGSMEELTMEDYDQIMAIDIRSPYYLIKSLLPLMKNASTHGDFLNSASIINVSSVHEDLAIANNIPYCMAKSAMKMMTKVLSIELAKYNIRVNNLSPGAIETDMNRDIIDEVGRDKFNKWIAVGRVAKAEEIKGPAIFLASNQSSYVTGTSLLADGGLKQNLVPYG